ncbi:hypothetical protein K474DRAFT_1665989 [Panus rudis PR-1116 ss-1]|nr:hypothetical protein K474DRAFT_1665989 [Panus rudis PR-1116 ss-1]
MMASNTDIEQTTTPKKAGPPFDDENADVILRSSDKVDFHIQKIFLTTASGVFRDILGIPGSSASKPACTPSGNPIIMIDITEHSKLLDSVLRFCHPAVVPPKLESLDDAYDLYRAADKYMLEAMKTWAKSYIESCVESNPAIVFAIACIERWKDLIHKAALATFKHTLSDLTQSQSRVLEKVPAAAMQRLWIFYERHRAETLKSLSCDVIMRGVADARYEATSPDYYGMDLPDPPEQPFYASKKSECCLSSQHVYMSEDEALLYVKKWWITFMEDVQNAATELPDVPSILRESLYRRAVEEAGRCNTCGPVAYGQLVDYTRALRARASGDDPIMELKLDEAFRDI